MLQKIQQKETGINNSNNNNFLPFRPFYSLTDSEKAKLVNIGDWLPFVSRTYNVSDKIEDYIFFPLVLLISDIPDKNGFAFPKTELTRFIRYKITSDGEVPVNQIAYQTWNKTGIFLEHESDYDENALGIVFDVSLLPFKCEEAILYKVIALVGIDKNKNPKITEKLLKNEINTFSQGSTFEDCYCSICGASMIENPMGCKHLNPYRRAPWEINTFNVNGVKKLAYWNASYIIGREISIVENPAYWCAQSDINLINNR